MKSILDKWRSATSDAHGGHAHTDSQDSVFFSAAMTEHEQDGNTIAPWEARAVEIDAKRMSASRGGKLLQEQCAKNKFMAQLPGDLVARMAPFMVSKTITGALGLAPAPPAPLPPAVAAGRGSRSAPAAPAGWPWRC